MGAQQLVESVTSGQLREEGFFPEFTIGDTINVHYTIVEGDKERVQVFQGVFISRNNRGINETITVRRIVANEGVERIFPLHSPRIAKIEVVRRGDAQAGVAVAQSAVFALLLLRHRTSGHAPFQEPAKKALR